MNLNIKTRTVRYNNKILVSDGGFSLGKNNMVNSLESPVPKSAVTKMKSHRKFLQKQAITPKDLGQSTIAHEDEKLPLYSL